MDYTDKRYQLGNYINDWWKKPCTILRMSQEMATVMYTQGGLVEDLPWHEVKGMPITTELLNGMGFSTLRETSNPYHKDITVATMINGRYYNGRGIIYEDKSLWSFHGITIRNIHEVQNIIGIMEPARNFRIDYLHS